MSSSHCKRLSSGLLGAEACSLSLIKEEWGQVCWGLSRKGLFTLKKMHGKTWPPLLLDTVCDYTSAVQQLSQDHEGSKAQASCWRRWSRNRWRTWVFTRHWAAELVNPEPLYLRTSCNVRKQTFYLSFKPFWKGFPITCGQKHPVINLIEKVKGLLCYLDSVQKEPEGPSCTNWSILAHRERM